MSLIPDLERDLVDAAARAPRRRARRRAVLVAAATGAAALTAAAAAVLGVTADPSDRRDGSPAADTRGGDVRCAEGEAPVGADSWRPIAGQPLRSLTVLGCGRLADGRRAELVARKFRGKGMCLDVYLPRARAALECAAGPIVHRPAPAIALSAFAPPGREVANRLGGTPLITGWATRTVARVELRFRANERERRREVTLIRVRAARLLAAAGERDPFGVFAFVPPEAMRTATLVALDAGGKPLARTTLPRGWLRQE
jgi:hypothetical protein